ncbi:MAG: hypothetical protein IK020_06520 [Clostridiales bacterium]|nr:hypothetical protein [Clostridiales bacterium]
MKKDEKKTIKLPEDLSFAAEFNCKNCSWANGSKGMEIWCEYHKQYYYPDAAMNCGHYSP